MLLQGKRVLIMGLLDTRSVAWAIGRKAVEQGAEVIYSVQSERFRDVLLRRSFKGEGLNVDDYRIIPCDVTKDEEIQALFSEFDALDGLGFQIRMNNLKIAVSEQVVPIVAKAMSVCGISGYRNDSPFALGQKLRDAYAASVMILNDRLYGTNATLLLVSKED